ncbi:HAMP domain-containing histidine kinase [Chloroflexales bacterium ZM16-3]|nr:HAMP domain-containing histidine kinase [Chloroflexales bacterium ZM16-3]
MSRSLFVREIRALPPPARRFFWRTLLLTGVVVVAMGMIVPRTDAVGRILLVLGFQAVLRLLLMYLALPMRLNGENARLYSSDLADVVAVALIGPWAILGALKIDVFGARQRRTLSPSPMRWVFGSGSDALQIAGFVLVAHGVAAASGWPSFSDSRTLLPLALGMLVIGSLTEYLTIQMITLASGSRTPPPTLAGWVTRPANLFHGFTLPLALVAAWAVRNQEWPLVLLIAVAAGASQWLLRYVSRAVEAESEKVAAQEREHALLRTMNTTLEARVAERTAQLSAANAELTAATQARITAIMQIAHDGRNRVQAQIASAYDIQFSLDDGQEAAAQAAVARLITTMMGQADLFDGMQRIAQAENGTLPLTLAPHDIVAMSRQIAAAYRDVAAAQHIRIAPPAAALAVAAWVDAGVLRRVFDNLIGNAIRYTAGVGTCVTICVEEDRENRMVWWTCRDDGIGLSAEALHRIGTQFARFGGADSPSGTGLGVWGAVQFVRAMHGTVIYESPGLHQGTTVRVQLPTPDVVLMERECEVAA